MSERARFVREQAAALQVAEWRGGHPTDGEPQAVKVSRYMQGATALADALGLTDAPAPECYAIPKAVCEALEAEYAGSGNHRMRAMLASIQHARGAQA